jgi:hypothetical protein
MIAASEVRTHDLCVSSNRFHLKRSELIEKSLCLQDTLTQRLDHWTTAAVVGETSKQWNDNDTDAES